MVLGEGVFFFLIGKGGSEWLRKEGSVIEVGLCGIVFDVDGELITFFHLFVI